MDTSRNPEQPAKCHTHLRHVYDCVWLALALILVLAGAVLWFFTGDIEHLYSGLFYAVFPFIGLLYNHFILLHPRRDPRKTQQRLEDLNRKQKRNARTVALVNGSMLLIALPILIIIGVAAAAEYGVGGTIIGGIAGSVWLVGGLAGITWWRRSRSKKRDQD